MSDRHRLPWAGQVAAIGMAIGVLSAWGAPAARACRTPVYRYAMYHWETTPYHVMYFHHGQPSEKDGDVNRRLSALAEAAGDSPGVNAVFDVIDVTKKEHLDGLPKPVVEAWKKHDDGSGPVHIVFTPWAVELFAGRLDAKTIKAMVDSPARKRLGELLQEGHATVWLILTGADADANERAEKTVADFCADVTAGKIEAPPDPDDDIPPEQSSTGDPDQAPDNGGEKAASSKLSVAVLKVSRTDAAETWLVRSLLAVAPDLPKNDKEPMVFAVFARGRAMPPLVGKGVTVENLTDCLMFLAGPCSCMVKDQNPGADLLMRWDWKATAEAMAAKDEQFSTGPNGYQASSRREARTASDTASPAAGKAETLAEKAALPQAKTPEAESQESFATRQEWIIGVGVLVGILAVAAVGFVILLFYRAG
jgi:hypothetical protein